MASYHLSAKTISRSHGRSATGAAAYRSGARIDDERTGLIHDYRRRQGVEAALLLLPAHAPDWASDRAHLWNAAELAETRKNSTVAREFEIALPTELDPEQRQRLAADFARELVMRHGCAADVAIHRPGRNGDSRNHHAHILLTTRRLTAAGFTEKTRELDDLKTGEIGRWRERFADLQNTRLREAGVEAHVDHRRLEAQGSDREATIHLGPTATALERRGVPTRLGESNRAVQANNAERQRDAEAPREAKRRETEPTTRQAEPQAAEAEARASAQENLIQVLREKTARLYPTAVFPSPLEAAFADPPPDRPPPPPEATEAERQRRADEAEPARCQQEAERRALLRADIPALERELLTWTRERQRLAGEKPPSATGLADPWCELWKANAGLKAAQQALDELETAHVNWRNAHKLALLLPAPVPGSKRWEAPAWERRLAEAGAALETARNALAVAQKGFNERLPEAKREAERRAGQHQQALAELQQRIDERRDWIEKTTAAQNAERERWAAEARAQAKAERPQAELLQRQATQTERPKGEPPPKRESPWYVPPPRPKPKYPAPGG